MASKYLYDEVKVAQVIVATRWCVATGDVLAIDLGRHRQVLTRRKSQAVLRIRQCEAIPKMVWADVSS